MPKFPSIGPVKELEGAQSQPWWLHNDPEDDIWQLVSHLDGVEESHLRIDWNYQYIRRSSVTTGREEHWKLLGKRFATCYMTSEKTGCNKTTSLALAAREFRSLFSFFCFERNCHDLHGVTKEDVRAYEKHLRGLNITKSTVTTKLGIVRMLWVLRDEVGEGLSFDPYIRANAISLAASHIGVPDGHTPTIYPEDFFRILNNCLEIIGRAERILSRLPHYLQISGECSHKRSTKARKVKRELGLEGGELIDQVRLLYGAAIVVILALFGERKHELSGTKLSEAVAVLDEERSELKGIVHKTARTISGKETDRPVIKELAQAIAIVIRLTDEARKKYDGDLLFLRLPFSSTANQNPQIELTTGKLYKLLDRVTKEVGYQRSLRPHMFRRSFSLIWAWRYEFGDMQLLSKMLYHNNEAFTKCYTEDEDVWRFLPEAQQQLAVEVMESALLGKLDLFGGFGRTLHRYGRRLLASATVLTPEKVHHFVERLLETDQIHVIANEHGYCFMSTKRARHAKCSTDGIGPDYINRKHEHCVKCANYGVTTNRREYWQKQDNAHSRVLETTDIPILRKAASNGRKVAMKVLAWFDAGKK